MTHFITLNLVTICSPANKLKFVKLSVFAVVLGFLGISVTAHANDSTGYIGTGGVQYIKNKNISMDKEDLYISKDIIKVDYEFKNLTDKDITETVLFPLPPLAKPYDGDFAYPEELIKSFKIYVNNKYISPALNIRTFMPVKTLTDGEVGFSTEMIDTTQLFKDCGVTELEMMGDWREGNNPYTYKKLLNCNHIALKKLQEKKKLQAKKGDEDDYIYWESQPIYSWKQTFKANTMTHVRHSYKPLVGGSLNFEEEHFKEFCTDKPSSAAQKKNYNVHSALKYILTTGANWATPIKDFTLTVERAPNEIMSFCWKGKGKIKKVGPTTFQIKEKNFVPTHDFHVAFIS